jgi:hypothetical protein
MEAIGLGLNVHLLGHRGQTGGQEASVDLNQAEPARSDRVQAVEMAKGWDGDPRFPRCFQQGLAFSGADQLTVE